MSQNDPRALVRRTPARPYPTWLVAILLFSAGACRSSDPGQPAPQGALEGRLATALASDQALEPSDVAVRIDGREYTLDQFQAYIVMMAGRQWVGEFVRLQLFEEQAKRLGLLPTAEEHELATQAALDEYIQQRFQGDRAAFDEDLARQELSLESFEQTVSGYTWLNLLQQAVVLAARVVTDDMVFERFEVEYGPGGLRTEVRHIILTRAREGIELARQGASNEERSQTKIEERLVARANEIMLELEGGADFAALAAKYSHDNQASRTGGDIERYDFLRYGPALAEAIAEAEQGVVMGPVVTPTAVHVFEVTGRTLTDLADVEDELRAELAAAPATPTEVGEAERALRERAEIWTYLMP